VGRVILATEVAGDKIRIMKLSYFIFSTSLGWMGILGSQDGFGKLILPQPSPEQVRRLLTNLGPSYHSEIPSEAETNYFGDLPQRIKHYLNGKPVSFPDRLNLSWASSFQRDVWKVTQSIPYGETRAYAWIAGELNKPEAARAVGQALARNPLPIIIPCHRVICSDGSLGGFGGGALWKRRLLEIEAKAT
jgi:methylated-DNA-[protein]-cysteine S-methyltransferase